MERAIDKVIADPAQSFSLESQVTDDHKTVTQHATNSSDQKSEPKPEHVFSGTLNNCTINICYK